MAELGIVEIIGLISIPAGGIIITTFLNMKAQRAATAAQFVTLMNNLAQEHTNLLRREKELAGTKTDDPIKLMEDVTNQVEDDCELHALSYCDLMERIAFLTIIDKIDKRITEKFDEYFEYVQLMMHWYDDVIVKNQQIRGLRHSKDRWPSILDWCEKNKVDGKVIKKEDAPIIADTNPQYLPELMISYWKLKNKSSYDVAKNSVNNEKPKQPNSD